MGATVFIMLKAFANGGSSLTGLEAISNGVGGLPPARGDQRPPGAGVMSIILGSLVLGVSLLAHITHAIPYVAGSPTVLSQEAKAVVRHQRRRPRRVPSRAAGDPPDPLHRGNTSFNGFPFLASFVAEDRFLPGP